MIPLWTTAMPPWQSRCGWAFAVDGDEALVRIHGGTSSGNGYKIDAVGHGTVEINARGGPFAPTPEVVCGTDGREDIACRLPALSANSSPVARLLFVSGASLFACTGSLVKGTNNSTLMTNNHCIASQSVTNTLQATFGFQRTGCGTGTIDAGTDFPGGTFLKTNNGLDYTLLTLQSNPELNWGELTPTTQQPSVGQQIWFIQHSGGNEKIVGFYEDGAHTTLCKVDGIDVTVGGATRKTQTTYACDSEGGASGSPIARASDGKVVALHHFGGISSNPCLNSGTEMNSICTNAVVGKKNNATPLLVCDSN